MDLHVFTRKTSLCDLIMSQTVIGVKLSMTLVHDNF